MIKVTDAQRKVLEQYFDNLDELLEMEDINEFLDIVDDQIIFNILENNDEPDDEGVRLQLIWDQIFNQN